MGHQHWPLPDLGGRSVFRRVHERVRRRHGRDLRVQGVLRRAALHERHRPARGRGERRQHVPPWIERRVVRLQHGLHGVQHNGLRVLRLPGLQDPQLGHGGVERLRVRVRLRHQRLDELVHEGDVRHDPAAHEHLPLLRRSEDAEQPGPIGPPALLHVPSV